MPSFSPVATLSRWQFSPIRERLSGCRMPWLFCLAMVLPLSASSSLSAVTIVLDYEDPTTFFYNNAVAKAAVDQAAADISAAITTTLTPLTTDVFTGSDGASSAMADWDFFYARPSDGSSVQLATPQTTPGFSADEVRVYVGMQHLAGSTLGRGSTGQPSVSTSGSIGSVTTFANAISQMETLSNTSMSRSSGPTISSLSGNLGGEAYDLDFGVFLGSLWMDSDTDNNSVTDSASDLGSYWHYDHTTPVAPGKNDLYSVALHEILHTIGYGTSQSWMDQTSGTTWLGPEAIAEQGMATGAGLLDSNPGHLASGLTSPTVVGGISQNPVMDPTITTGTRKYLTQLDLAILRDIGYQTVPEPDFRLFALLSLGILMVRFRRR